MELSPRESLITLNLIPGLGSVRIQSLLSFFGSAELVLAAPHRVLENVPRIGPKLARAIASWRDCTNVHAELALAESHGVRVVTIVDDDYPAALRRMSDPPIVLYVRGEWLPADGERGVAIVGSRAATPYGMSHARRFGRELADAGCTIISGLARGIDTAGHWGALDAGGRTIAVLGSGLAHLFPQENSELAHRICNGHGAVVSEFPMTLPPGRTTFPQRNRIVAAWAKAVLVAEAPHRSGALHTAAIAADYYGNTVFALPGSIDSPSSVGCHGLIRDGAILCTTPQELLRDMNWSGPAQQMELFPAEEPTEEAPRPEPTDCVDRADILAAVAAGHDTLDALCSALGLRTMQLTPQLMRLQIERAIIPLPGGRYSCC
ncbi:MAG: DNA-processing protein DprA [Akkermansia sp.]|nr:DNA-processing protein DprA [Akkermansia sp.]